MFLATLGTLFLLLPPALPSQSMESAPFLGHWEGRMVQTPGEYELDFDVDLVREGDGLRGRIDYITQGTGVQDVEKLAIDGPEISFSTRDEQGIVTSFDGFLAADGLIAGDLKEGEHHAPFTLRHGPPRSLQPAPLIDLDRQPDELRNRFNQDRDRLRVVMIVSPTCGGCRMGALLMQRHVLAQVGDPRLRIYVVWEGIGKLDTPATAAASGALLSDSRVVNFWSSHRFAGNAFKAGLDAEKPLWDVFLVYLPQRTWGDAVPVPDDYMHNRGRTFPSQKLFNGIELAKRIRVWLGAAPSS